MSTADIMKRHPVIFGKPLQNKYGICPICNIPLVRENTGSDDVYICCPSHEAGHMVYLEGDRE